MGRSERSNPIVATNMSSPRDPKWRRYGRARRQWLIDHQSEPPALRISSTVAIERYYELGRQLWIELLELQHDADRLEDAYVLAHRLHQFLDDLKRHSDFHKAPQFPLLPRLLEQLAIRIDEEQLNNFVDMSMEPTITEEDDPSWESFSGWSFDVPGCADTTDESSYSQQSSQPSPTQPQYESFLEHIATQSVEFESDSEAADSWAPSVASSAFAQQYHRHQNQLATLQQQLERLQADDSF